MSAPLTYDVVGHTEPAAPTWTAAPPGYRRLERTVPVGRGDACWEASSAALLDWAVKTRSGFAVRRVDGGPSAVAEGADYEVRAGVGPLGVTEPVRVVAVVRSADRCGFAYGTRRGHPVSGEEAFVVHRDAEGRVSLTLRSLTRASPDAPWRHLFPALLLAQRVYRRRYERSLR